MKYITSFMLAVVVAGAVTGCAAKPTSQPAQSASPPAASSSNETSSVTTPSFDMDEPPLVTELMEKIDSTTWDQSLAPSIAVIKGTEGSSKEVSLPIIGEDLLSSGITFRFSSTSMLSGSDFLTVPYSTGDTFEASRNSLYLENGEYCTGWQVYFLNDEEFSGTLEDFISQDKSWILQYKPLGSDPPATYADVFGGDNTQVIDPFTALDVFGKPSGVTKFSTALNYPQYVFLYDYGDWVLALQFGATQQADGSVTGRLSWAGFATPDWMAKYITGNDVSSHYINYAR